MPKIRSDGARSTGAATTSVRTSAIAETAATSAARPRIGHHGDDDKERSGERPCADVANVGHEPAVAHQEMQGREDDSLREPEQREAGHERPPVEDHER